MYVKHAEVVEFDGEQLRAFITRSPFNCTQLSKYLGHGNAYIAQICTAGRVCKGDWDKLADLLSIKIEDFAPRKAEAKTKVVPSDDSEMIKLLASINAHLANCEQYLNNINARSKAMHDDMREWKEGIHKELLELKACWK